MNSSAGIKDISKEEIIEMKNSLVSSGKPPKEQKMRTENPSKIKSLMKQLEIERIKNEAYERTLNRLAKRVEGGEVQQWVNDAIDRVRNYNGEG